MIRYSFEHDCETISLLVTERTIRKLLISEKIYIRQWEKSKDQHIFVELCELVNCENRIIICLYFSCKLFYLYVSFLYGWWVFSLQDEDKHINNNKVICLSLSLSFRRILSILIIIVSLYQTVKWLMRQHQRIDKTNRRVRRTWHKKNEKFQATLPLIRAITSTSRKTERRQWFCLYIWYEQADNSLQEQRESSTLYAFLIFIWFSSSKFNKKECVININIKEVRMIENDVDFNKFVFHCSFLFSFHTLNSVKLWSEAQRLLKRLCRRK